MRLHSFSDLCEIDFHTDHLSVSGSLDKPFRTYRCPSGHMRTDRFYYIEAGSYSITQDGHERITVAQGDILYLPNNCTYRAEWTSEEIGYKSVLFTLNDGEEFSLSDSICIAAHDKNQVALGLISRLFTVWTKGEIGSNLRSKALFYELLHFVTLENIRSELSNSHAAISPAIIYLENNYATDISVAELAKMCSMCESRFRAKFTEYAGMSPIKYRNYLRIKKAAELLSGGEYTVSETAELVGIGDISYFSRLFKEQTGKNPGSLRFRA